MKETEVYEICPHCGLEAHLFRDIEADGYKAYCPNCGGRLMLCDECMHGQGYCCGGCDYDSETDSCKHNPPSPSEQDNGIGLLLKSAIADYNVAVRQLCRNYNARNETIAYKKQERLYGIRDCLKAQGSNVVFDYADTTFFSEITGYEVKT